MAPLLATGERPPTASSITYGTESTTAQDTAMVVEPLRRHLSLFALVAIGIGITVGSGLFVLCGFVAKHYAGPATSLSWLIGGVTACLSGSAYAELSARVPAAGSAYAYAFVAIGELPALLAAACLSVEYLVAPAAVARSWGSKVVIYLTATFNTTNSTGETVADWFQPSAALLGFSPLGALITTICTGILLAGVRESKMVTNVVTITKVSVVLYMVFVGFFFVTASNWEPFIPPEFGVAGVFRGATASFLGYIGYDEIACLAGEAKNPKRNLPLATMITLGSITILYTLSALSLTGMQPFNSISAVSGFPAAFRYNDATFSAQLTALGELATLPVVVLLAIMAQPRLQHALAEDGLIPAWFGVQTAEGNLWNGTVFAGGVTCLAASFIPFHLLSAMISSAVLVSLSITDTSLILLWHESPESNPILGDVIMLSYQGACLVTGLALTHFIDSTIGRIVAAIGAILMLGCVVTLVRRCPKSDVFGGRRRRYAKDSIHQEEDGYFRTPFVPYLPCVAIFVNWYLLSQLHLEGILLTLAFLGLTCVYYYTYAIHRSVGNTGVWDMPHH